MTNRAYDHLADSILFDDERLEDNLAGETDNDIRRHLAEYRTHVLSSLGEILDEARSQDGLSVLSETRNRTPPSEKLLLQSALYLDRLVVPDPVFRFTAPTDAVREQATEQLLGKKRRFPRSELAAACRYMKQTTPFVAGGFLKYVPSTIATEPPSPVPITYSPSLHTDVIPRPALAKIRGRAQVRAIQREGNKLIVTGEAPDATTDSIWVRFDDHPNEGWPYAYHDIAIVETDEDARTAAFTLTPGAPPNEQVLRVWIEQSVNQSANALYIDTCQDVALAARVGAMFLTTSPLVADVLGESLDSAQQDIETHTARTLLSLELPILDGIDPWRLMELRERESAALRAFRIGLESRLRELRGIDDARERDRRVLDIAHALSREEVAAVEGRVKAAKHGLAASVVQGFAAVGVAVHAGAPTIFLALLALGYGLQSWKETAQVKQLPGYFLWRLKRK